MRRCPHCGEVILPKGAVRKTIPTAPLRKAVLESEYTPSEIARRIGWMTTKTDPTTGRKCTVGDGHRVRKAVGIRKTTGGRITQTSRVNTAVLLIRAMDLSPVDFGL